MKGWLIQGFIVVFLSPFILINQSVYAADESAPVDEAIDIGAVEIPAEPEEYDALFGSWGGLKDDLAANGIGIEAVVTGNVMGLTSGGLDRGLYQTFAYQATATIDTESAGLWSNGTFNFSGVALTGPPIHKYVGDYQWANSIDSYDVDTLQLYEAWYEHTFMDGALSVLGGMYEYNSDFYSLDYGTSLVNSSFFFGAELSQIGNSTYPVTSLAARVKYQPTETTYVAFAAFDGVPGSPSNYDGTVIKLKKDDGVFYAGEFGVTSSEDDAETGYYKFAIGGWYSTTDFIDYMDRERDDNGGGYIIGEAKIFSECDSPSQGLGIFGQYGMNPGSRNIVSKYIGAGLHYTGLIPGRDEDITAFGVASAITGTQYTDDVEGATRAETAIELTHRIPLMPGVALQPDLQYIVRPGFNSEVSHAMIVGARIDVVF